MREIHFIQSEPRPRSVLMRVLGFLVGAAILAVSALLGFFLLAGIFGFALIAGLVIYARLWWLRRRMRAETSGQAPGDLSTDAGESEYIEAEYRVVRESRRD